MAVQTEYRLGRSAFRTFEEGLEKEWVLTNGIGGFANSTVIGASSRVFSSYLIAALHPPVDRMLILAKTHEEVIINGNSYDFAAQEYPGEIRQGQKYLNYFTLDVLPSYTYQAEDLQICKTVTMMHGKNAAAVCYEVKGGSHFAELVITPLFHCRPFGSVTESKKDLDFAKEVKQKREKKGGLLTLKPEKYPNLTIEFFASAGEFYDRAQKKTSMATPNYLIDENEVFRMDQRTGFTGVDHMATPYDVRVVIPPEETVKFYVSCSLLSEEGQSQREIHAANVDGFLAAQNYKKRIYELMDRVSYDNRLARRLAWAADAFVVERESTGLKTVLAGLPWFSDWGRDTMIALQGLTMAAGRPDDARSVLESFSKYVKNGMIPNVFPNQAGEEPGYNTIDASLWYFYSVDQYLKHDTSEKGKAFIRETIYPCLKEIVSCYQKGTAYGIHMDTDGLIQGGSDLDQLTWMDVRVGDVVVTPRHGKPVEINALWYNALKVMQALALQMEPSGQAEEIAEEYGTLAKQVKKSFRKKFWNPEEECLYDVITVTEIPKKEKKSGKNNGKPAKKTSEQKEIPDGRIRPNQIYAVSLPYTMLPPEKEKKVVQKVYEKLYTPYGLRSLSPDDPEYKKEYTGKLIKRDMAYHMGTAWAYLSGAFITAFIKTGEAAPEVLKQAEEMCHCFEDHMEDGCLNGIAEIFDGDFSCTGRGCYTQAWSVGELLRVYKEEILARKQTSDTERKQ